MLFLCLCMSKMIERCFHNGGYSAALHSSVAIAIVAGYFLALSAVKYISRSVLLHRAFAVTLGADNYVSMLISDVFLLHSVMFVPSNDMGQYVKNPRKWFASSIMARKRITAIVNRANCLNVYIMIR